VIFDNLADQPIWSLHQQVTLFLNSSWSYLFIHGLSSQHSTIIIYLERDDEVWFDINADL
jgi:hypothetical protein